MSDQTPIPDVFTRPAEDTPERSTLGRVGSVALRIAYVLGLFLIIAAIYVWWAASRIPDREALLTPPQRPSAVVLDRNGVEIGRRGDATSPQTRLELLPQHLVSGVIEVEDQRFFDHGGLDFIGATRAMSANIAAGRVVQGGSTITQQLAKNLFLTPKRTLERKVQEAVLARWLERRFTKTEILELYLNRVYFGSGAWGVEAAAQTYFGKPASAVSVGEAAVLVGLLQAPSRLSPLRNRASAEDRANAVLAILEDRGAVSADALDAAYATPVRVQPVRRDAVTGHFVDWVVGEARKLPGLAEQDLVITTTLDSGMQQAAFAAVQEGLTQDLRDRGATQAALIAMEGDGAVRALVGGRDYQTSQFNRAVEARRQPGSAFKPFVYVAALRDGLTPQTRRTDEPVTVGTWSPRNYNDGYLGRTSLETAFARSLNSVSVTLTEEVGRNAVVRAARDLGITSALPSTPSVALGAYEVTPLELTAAYAPFANQGYRVAPYAVTRVADARGRSLYTRQRPQYYELVLVTRVRSQMVAMMRAVMETGTGRSAALADRPSAGKTGTTNAFRDAWFVGFVPGFVAGVWVGDDANGAMDEITGGGAPAAIWNAFMARALADQPVKQFTARPMVASMMAARRPVRQDDPGPSLQ